MRPSWHRLGAVVPLTLGGLTLLAMLAPHRLPAGDLAQHARLIQLIASPDERHDLGLELAPASPYWLFYLVALPFRGLLGSYGAAQLSFALAGALLVVGTGLLARRLGRPTHLAAAALLSVFGCTFSFGLVGLAWGYATLVLAMLTLEHHLERPRPITSAALATMVLVSYEAHAFTWALFLAFAAASIALAPVRWRTLLLPLATTLGTIAIAIAYASSIRQTPYLDWLSRDFVEVSHARRAWDLLTEGAWWGDARRAGWACLPFKVALAALVGLSLTQAFRRPHPAVTARTRLFALRYAIVAIVSAAASLLATSAYFLYLRFIPLAWLGLALAVPPPRGRAARPLAWALVIAGLPMLAAAWQSGVELSAAVRCFDEAAPLVRPGARLFAILRNQSLPNDRVPTLRHLYLLPTLDKPARPYFDFSQVGTLPVRPAAATRLAPLPVMKVHAHVPGFPQPHPDDFDVVLTLPRLQPDEIFEPPPPPGRYRRASCGDLNVDFR